MKNQIRRNHTGHRMGEHHQKARLSDGDVIKMRRMYEQVENVAAVARAFGCSYWTCYDIVKYKTR